jgi:hypothetical protein
MVMIGIKAKVGGPMFARDVIRQGVRGAVQATLDVTAARLSQQLRSGPKGVFLSVKDAKKRGSKPSTGNYRRNVGKTKRMISDYNAFITDGGVIYGPWLEGTSTRNQSTRFEGYGTFRKTAQHIQKNLRKIIAVPIARMKQRMRG